MRDQRFFWLKFLLVEIMFVSIFFSINVFAFDLSEIKPYTDSPWTIINNNVPDFSDKDFSTNEFEFYSALDSYGRSGCAYANICLALMPTEARGEIGNIKPSGWHTVKYDIIEDRYLYNRCHLIGYQLAGENSNELNLITGTRYLNVEGMLPFEDQISDYILETGHHVLYRVTPIYEGDNLVASGVQMEAKSVEDNGAGIEFNVYCYNVQPGIWIDYKTGDSALSDKISDLKNTDKIPLSYETEISTEQVSGDDYVLNTNTKKFHYPYCDSVDKMKEKNKQYFTGSRDDIINRGYVPCKNCNP